MHLRVEHCGELLRDARVAVDLLHNLAHRGQVYLFFANVVPAGIPESVPSNEGRSERQQHRAFALNSVARVHELNVGVDLGAFTGSVESNFDELGVWM